LNHFDSQAEDTAKRAKRAKQEAVSEEAAVKTGQLRQGELLKKEAYDEAKKLGFDAGYLEGKKLGEQEAKDIALAEAEEKLNEKLATLESLLSALNAPCKRIEAQVFEQLSSLALHVAEEVIQRQISGQSEWVMQTIQQAIDVLGDDLSPLEISLNPADAALIESIDAGFSKHWTVKPTEKVASGTCQIKQNVSSIEHNWRNRFEQMSVKLEAQALAEQAD